MGDLLITSHEHECSLVYKCFLRIRLRYFMHDHGILEVILSVDGIMGSYLCIAKL